MYREGFGKRLRRARMSAGYTQEELAQETNTTKSQISRWENNQLEPNIEQLGTIADFLSVSVDWLISTEGENRRQNQ